MTTFHQHVSTINDWRHNLRSLWKTVNNILQPPAQLATDRLSAVNFAKSFIDRVANIRVFTSAAAVHHHHEESAAVERIQTNNCL